MHGHISRPVALAFAIGIAVLGGCGGGDDELVRPDEPASPKGGARATKGSTDASQVAETLREFRRRYESRDPSACDLVTSRFTPSTGGTSPACEEAVQQQRFDYAIVALSRVGNRVGERTASVLTTIRVDNPPDADNKPREGIVRLRKEGTVWLIEGLRLRPR